jgi:hypothetical protein
VWSANNDHDVRSPTDLGLRPGRSMGVQGEWPAATVATVRSSAPGRSSCGARALRRISRPRYLAGRLLFSGVYWAVDPVRHRLSHGLAYLHEDAPSPANISACRELDRACGRLYRGLLRARGKVTPSWHDSRIEERRSLHRSSVRRLWGETLARIPPGVRGGHFVRI